ncbi:MAG: N-acetylmuramoyl-L-alanine amidase, partial [Chloroflexi bacterium]|nr:N-acetylmuramoyl-L-alanine amidase [Chloroflexota bacterium]
MSVNAMKRMGSQSLGGNDLVAQAVQRGKPAVFKVVDPDPGWVQRLHQASPQTVLVGRIVDNSLAGRLTAAEGRNFAGRVLARARELQDTIRWWEGSNEAASGPDAIKRLCEFERTFAERLQAEGYHALVGGFSTGVPQIVGPDGKVPWMGEWELFYPAMQIADGVHFHEYWNPKELDDRWNAYRFTMWWDALPAWAREKWWLVSELGVDGGLAEIDARKGWSDYIDGGRYLNLLNAYAQTLEHYPRIATAIYVTGLGADTSWRTYDICHTPVLDTLTAAWASVPPVAWGTAVPAPVLLAPDARNLIGQLPVRQGTQGYTGSRRLADIDIFLVHWLGAAGQDLTPETVWQDQVTHQDAGREQFPAGAFTFQVRQDGSLAQLHSLTTVTWQTQGTDPVTGQFVNDISIGVALEPERGAQGYRWTGPQIKTCQALYHWLCQTLGRNLRVLGHNEATPPTQTDCPGPAWPAQLKPQLMGGTEGGEGSPPPAPVTTVW